MQLNRFTDYGLRVLIFLSGQSPRQRISLDFLARHFNINKHHLHKVSQRLSRLGWVESARGKNGGICLGASARTLTLADIIDELEPERSPIDCEGVQCPIAGTCRLQQALHLASDAFREVLARYRLEDVLISDLAMVRLLAHGTVEPRDNGEVVSRGRDVGTAQHDQ